jgi:hypothetical protein
MPEPAPPARAFQGQDFRVAFRRRVRGILWGIPILFFPVLVVLIAAARPLQREWTHAVAVILTMIASGGAQWWLWRCPACRGRLIHTDWETYRRREPITHDCGARLL